MLDLNVSQIQAFIRCPRYWYHRYVAQRSDERESAALRMGTAWHLLMEKVLVDPDLGQLLRICEMTSDEWERTLFMEGLAQFHQWMEDSPEYELLDAEMELDFVLDGRFRIFGKLDRLVKFNGSYWHMQHKTLAANKFVPSYITSVRRSLHEYAYRRMCEAHELTPYGGTILFILRKNKDPLSNPPLIVPPAHLATADTDGWREQSLMYWCNQIARMQAPSVVGSVPQNPEACLDWGLCEYIDVCDNRKDITDLPVKNPYSHYDPK